MYRCKPVSVLIYIHAASTVQFYCNVALRFHITIGNTVINHGMADDKDPWLHSKSSSSLKVAGGYTKICIKKPHS